MKKLAILVMLVFTMLCMEEGLLSHACAQGFLNRSSGETGKAETALTVLPCSPGQNIVPFRDGLLYDDGTILYHLSGSGEVRWSYDGGPEMKFSAGPAHVAVWNSDRLALIDHTGRVTCSMTPEDEVQFVRVGEQYVAIASDSDTSPKLSIRNMEGGQEDSIANEFDGLALLDAGFFGDGGRYLWTLAIDVYGPACNTILDTYEVGKMNYGRVSLGENLPCRIVAAEDMLQVFTTQTALTYDYRCIPDSGTRAAVHGWNPIGVEVQERGSTAVLLAPSRRASGEQVSMIRVLEGNRSRWYMLPMEYAGACLYEDDIWAVSGNYVFRVDGESGKVTQYPVPGLETGTFTAFFGLTTDGNMLAVLSDGRVCAFPLPSGNGTAADGTDGPVMTGEHYTGDCLIIRDETVYNEANVSGIEYIAGEGDEVAAGTTVCKAFSTGYTGREKANLQDCRDMIRDYQLHLLEKETEPDTTLEKLDSDILVQLREARTIIHGGRGSLISAEKQLKDAVRVRRDYLKNKYCDDQRLARLYDDEQTQLMRIGSWIKQYAAQSSGIVSFYSDGYERRLTGNNFEEFTPSEVRKMIDSIRSPQSLYQQPGLENITPVCRLVRNNPWYVLMAADETGWTPVEGAKYRLVLVDAGSMAVNATVVSCCRTDGELLIRLLVSDTSVPPPLYIRTCRGILMLPSP